MTLYATGTRPEQFQRGYAQSPSTWWNQGDVGTQLMDTYTSNGGIRPTAVVMQMGTQEGLAMLPYVIPPTVWMVTFEAVAEAWLSIGMGSAGTVSTSSQYYSSTASYPTLNSNLVVFKNTGGMHVAQSWADTFTYGLTAMYAPSFPAPYTKQRNSNYDMYYPTIPTAGASGGGGGGGGGGGDDDCQDDLDASKGVVAGLSVTLVVVLIAAGVGTWRVVYKGGDGLISLSESRESQL
jgi:hypothetical protein